MRNASVQNYFNLIILDSNKSTDQDPIIEHLPTFIGYPKIEPHHPVIQHKNYCGNKQ